jgi:hypothetical protein
MKRFIEFTGGTLQALEFVTFVCLAAALVLIGPVLWSYQLFNAERIYAAVIVAILWPASLITLGYEIQGKAITSISGGIFLGWLVALAWVFSDRFV